MKIKMLRDQKGSENGVEVKTFNKDQIYLMKNDLAEVFVKEKWAVNLETPENLEQERKEAIKILGEKLTATVNDCFQPELDSIQLIEKIDVLKSFEITKELFQERFKAAKKIKDKGIKEAKESLKALNKSKSNKGKK